MSRAAGQRAGGLEHVAVQRDAAAAHARVERDALGRVQVAAHQRAAEHPRHGGLHAPRERHQVQRQLHVLRPAALRGNTRVTLCQVAPASNNA